MTRHPPANDSIEQRVRALGAALWARAEGETPRAFNPAYWEGRLLEWAMKDEAFRIDLFRFVDVLPSLRTSEQIVSHLREYLVPHAERLPGALGAGLHAAEALTGGLASGLAARAVRGRVEEMAHRFIAGSDLPAALPRLKELHDEGFAFSVDVLGEMTLSDAEAHTVREHYGRLIEQLPAAVSGWRGENSGALPIASVSLKLSALDSWLDPVDTAGCVARLKAAALPLFLKAKECRAFLHVDMEHWDLHGITLDLFEELIADPGLRDWPHLGITVQAYTTAARRDADRLIALARSRGTPFTVRLVKGAYWDSEVTRSRQKGIPCPVFTDKAATDASYEEIAEVLLTSGEEVSPAFAGHNLRSLCRAMAVAEAASRPSRAFEFQTLYGMAEPERRALLHAGHRVRVYCPVGDLLPGMAYLVRRLLENTANTGFLRLGHREKIDLDTLLQRPEPRPAGDASPEQGFRNCPLADFTDPAIRRSFAEAVANVSGALPLAVPIVVGGQERPGAPVLEVPCPSDTTRVSTRQCLATRAEVDQAVSSALGAWPAWRDRSIEERAELLEGLADRLEKDRWHLAALQVFEEAKPWREADADVAEAVDYCRYYALRAREALALRVLGQVPGERNLVWYEGRGVAAVIAPWNFPLAILCGMAAAALVAGNTVILKPAEQSGAVGYALFRHLAGAGFPSDVVHFLPGLGEDVGAALVEHKDVAQIAFTGSLAVGGHILQTAGTVRPGQRQVKRVVCEMGGKNAIVVDEDADLDEAVSGVLTSAFGYAGQKCSACSRVIVVGSAWDPFVARLVDACRSLRPSPAHDPACRLGPVIDADAHERLLAVLRNPGPGAVPLFVGAAPDGGWYAAPAVFRVDDTAHRLMQEELFGPMLALFHAQHFDDALEAALATPYALTGAVYSRLPSHLRQAEQRFRVGNLYLNRPCTGAVVARQPFGGFGLSGLGTKAGGPDYLLHFADPRTSCENTMRRGFTPEIAG